MLRDVLRGVYRGQPLEPRPLADVEALGVGRFRAPRESGQLELRAGGGLPSGWIDLDFALSASALRGPPRLLVDAGEGFADGTAITLALPRNGRIRAILRLPEHVVGLRLEMSARGEFSLGPLAIRKLVAIEAGFRLAAPVLRKRLSEPRDIPIAAMKLARAFAGGGPRAVLERLMQKRQHESPQIRYGEWHERFGVLTDADRAAIRAAAAALPEPPRFSVVLPVYETPEPWLRRAIESVRAQLYPHWELCIADDASKAPHVRRVLEEARAGDPRVKLVFRDENGHISAASNSALELATGDWIALLDHDDELTEHALYLLAEEICAHRDADLVYSDEDKLDNLGRLFDPHFKPDWNPDLLFSQNYVAHLCALRAAKVRQVGGFRTGFEGSQDYDLVLRIAAASQPARLRHVPHVLYHWRAIEGSTALSARAKDYAETAARRALEEQTGARVEVGALPTTYRVRWPLPQPAPLVSLVIPTRDARALLETCVETLLSKTAYRSFELIVVDNQSRDRSTLRYFEELQQRAVARVLPFDRPFNYSAINNFAVGQSRGQIVGLLNNDVEIIDGDWLGEMVAHAARSDVGVVGAKLLYPDRTVQHAGVILGIGGVAGHCHKNLAAESPGYFSRASLTQNFSAVTAACLLVRRETFAQVGGFDETIPVAFNDVDFCLRVRAAGYRNVWTPHAVLVHHESKSRGREDSRAKRARFRRESEAMLARWGKALLEDPAYNPNLTLDAENFSLAWPPRVRRPWEA